MLLSMTGYGKSKGEFEGRGYIVDIRTLNGKTTDLRMKLPTHLKSREMDIRRLVLTSAQRGKMDLSIQMNSGEADLDIGLNLNLIEKYYKDLQQITTKYNIANQDFLQTIIRIPNVIQSKDEEVDEGEWSFIVNLLNETLGELSAFRTHEGSALKSDLLKRVSQIGSLLEQVAPHENKRSEQLKSRLQKLAEENLSPDNMDQNRLEQEVVYYLEKLDIHEEKVRLQQHCNYFVEVVDSSDHAVGKKLNFIAQEMGREINTLGAKAQYSPIQQIVVQMKVELDQIKEQLANVL